MKNATFHQMYFHIVWATKQRLPLLESRSDCDDLVRILIETAGSHGVIVLAANAWMDHIHLLVSLPPCDIAEFVGRCKGGSAFTYNRRDGKTGKVVWQTGYGIVSLRRSDTPVVVQYILEQEWHHGHNRAWKTLEITGVENGPT